MTLKSPMLPVMEWDGSIDIDVIFADPEVDVIFNIEGAEYISDICMELLLVATQ